MPATDEDEPRCHCCLEDATYILDLAGVPTPLLELLYIEVCKLNLPLMDDADPKEVVDTISKIRLTIMKIRGLAICAAHRSIALWVHARGGQVNAPTLIHELH